MEDNLKTSVQYIKSVGPSRAESFAEIGIKNVRDLLFYFPTRYLDRTTLVSSLQVLEYVRNGYEGEVTIIGEVINSEVIRYGKKQLFKVKMKDKTGIFECVWFQGIKYFKNNFKDAEVFAISAKPIVTRYGHIQFVHPDFDKLATKESTDFFNTGKIIPFYRLPKELKSKNIGDFSLRKIIHAAVENFADKLEETLPNEIIEKYNLPEIKTAVKNM
ncbi:MAG: DNA helicase RecG, partial [Melioribacteraceae bacterium]